MGIFGRRRHHDEDADAPQPADRLSWITAEARRMLAEQGVETTIEHGDAPEDVLLRGSDSRSYPLYNAYAKTAGRSRAEALALLDAHLRSVTVGMDNPEPTRLTADQLRRQVRARLLPRNANLGEASFGYARPVTDELMTVLAIDFPETVGFVTDNHVPGLALPLDELFAYGSVNTDAEPIEEVFEATPGVFVASGSSLFIASKAANLEAVFGPAPHGTLFTAPHRSVLVALPIDGAETVARMNALVAITMRVLESGPPPGGPLAPEVHFARDGVITRVSSFGDDGSVTLEVDARLAEALEQALGGTSDPAS